MTDEPTTRAERIAQHPGGVVVRTIEPPHPVTPAQMTEERWAEICEDVERLIHNAPIYGLTYGDEIELDCHAEIDRLRTFSKELQYEWQETSLERDRLTAENERLRAALKRIAEESCDGDPYCPEWPYAGDSGSGHFPGCAARIAWDALHPKATK